MLEGSEEAIHASCAPLLLVEQPHPVEAHFRSIKAKCQVGRGRWLGQNCTALDYISVYLFLVREHFEAPNCCTSHPRLP